MANVKTGKVIKRSGKDTATVLVVTYKNHPVYKKRFIYSKKYLVHDPGNAAALDDTVVIRQSRPISRRKRWVLEKVAAKADSAQTAARELAAGLGAEQATVEPKRAPAKPKAKAPAEKAVRAADAAKKPAGKTAAKKPAAKPAAKKPAAKKKSAQETES